MKNKIKTFIKNPLEAFFNIFGYSVERKPSLLLNHIQSTTQDGWLRRMSNNNNINNYKYELYYNL